MWKVLKENENYAISENGEIFSFKKNIILKPRIYKNGYIGYLLAGKEYYLHRLLFNNYIKTIKNNLCIDHIDNNKRNNSLNNLRMLSRAENTRIYFKEQRYL